MVTESIKPSHCKSIFNDIFVHIFVLKTKNDHLSFQFLLNSLYIYSHGQTADLLMKRIIIRIVNTPPPPGLRSKPSAGFDKPERQGKV